VTRDRPVSARGVLLVVVSAVLVAGLVLMLTSGDSHRRTAQPAPATPSTTTSLATQGLTWQSPDTVALSQSPVQVADDQQLEQESAQDPGLAQLERMKVPAPAISGGWPHLPVASSPEMWATEFVTGLLDVDYARQSRPALGPWLQAEEAPLLIPGIPASAADKELFATVLDQGLVQVAGPPIATVSQWAANARSGVRQTVTDLLTQSDPGWQQVISSGWQPPDARTAVIDVSGLLTVSRGSKMTVTHFTVAVGTGSARWHAGYGTAEVEEWQS
jgi:hypothetical protein